MTGNTGKFLPESGKSRQKKAKLTYVLTESQLETDVFLTSFLVRQTQVSKKPEQTAAKRQG